jgi:hypothetical protein
LLYDFSEIHFVLTTSTQHAYSSTRSVSSTTSPSFTSRASTSHEIDFRRHYSVSSPTISTSHVKGWSRLRDSLRAQDIDFARQGVEQPKISDFVLTSTTRHASTSTQFTSRSNDSSVFFTNDVNLNMRSTTVSAAKKSGRQRIQPTYQVLFRT